MLQAMEGWGGAEVEAKVQAAGRDTEKAARVVKVRVRVGCWWKLGLRHCLGCKIGNTKNANSSKNR